MVALFICTSCCTTTFYCMQSKSSLVHRLMNLEDQISAIKDNLIGQEEDDSFLYR